MSKTKSHIIVERIWFEVKNLSVVYHGYDGMEGLDNQYQVDHSGHEGYVKVSDVLDLIERHLKDRPIDNDASGDHEEIEMNAEVSNPGEIIIELDAVLQKEQVEKYIDALHKREKVTLDGVPFWVAAVEFEDLYLGIKKARIILKAAEKNNT